MQNDVKNIEINLTNNYWSTNPLIFKPTRINPKEYIMTKWGENYQDGFTLENAST